MKQLKSSTVVVAITLIWIVAFGLVAMVSGCANPDSTPHLKIQTERADVREYRSHHGDVYWYWYFLYTDSTNVASPSYYFRSSTPVTNYSSVVFRLIPAGQLPQDAKETLETGQLIKEESIKVEDGQIPDEMKEEIETEAQENVMTNEGGPPAPEETSSAPVESSSSSSSSDSGSSGGDSGGGDAGGGSD